AGVDRLRFYAFDDGGLAAYRTGAAHLDEVVAPGGSLSDVLERVAARNYQWGRSDGN
ncbi:MAG: hypothetical protein H0V17_06230, partial [Deltaproteobacteria bacterium]|nr:hypothetical protein [Deltaproteobacteria bacterium]